MKQALINMLHVLETQTTFIAQLAGDVAALKTVVCSLDAQTAKQFEEQAGLFHRRLYEVVEAQRQEIESLKKLISQLPNQKTN